MIEKLVHTNQLTVNPILRWAGGKRWLTDFLKSELLYNATYNNYHEPFLGGGAVFFSLENSKLSYLNDLNQELIFTYNVLKENCDKVLVELSQFDNNETQYYAIREKKFKSDFKKAAQFLYLNHFSFNGIYRVNLKGVYNVPYGHRTVPIDFENIRRASLKLKNALLSTGDFYTMIDNINTGDLVFLDPPYTVAHNNNGFIKYNQKIFSIEDQYRLAELIKEISKKKAYFILTNAAHEKIKTIFSELGQKLIIQRNSLIGGLNAKRGKVDEYLFTNIPR